LRGKKDEPPVGGRQDWQDETGNRGRMIRMDQKPK